MRRARKPAVDPPYLVTTADLDVMNAIVGSITNDAKTLDEIVKSLRLAPNTPTQSRVAPIGD